MKRVGRWAFNFVAAASLGLCAASIVAWGTDFTFDRFIDAGGGGYRGGEGDGYNYIVSLDRAGSLRVCWSKSDAFGAGINLPLWLVIALSAVAPAVWLSLAFRRSNWGVRAASSLCPICAYDLRATPDRCPECGTSRVRRSR